MAIEIDHYSESSGSVMSPRISFSYDLSQTDVVPVEYLTRSNSTSSLDFDFCVFRESFDNESSSADELFSDGKILPFEIKKRIAPRKQLEPPMPPPPQQPQPRPRPTHAVHEKKMDISESSEKQSAKSFWRFKRSSSLNCGSGYARSLCPLPLLSRSNSTGSASSGKRSALSKDGFHHKQQNWQKSSSIGSMNKQSQSSYYSSSASYQKPPLKKGYGSYGNGVRIIPVLNVPTANLFGFGAIFSSGKDKNKKK